MKSYRNYFIIGFLLVFSGPLQAQKWMEMWKDPQGASFFDIQREFYAYFKTHEPGKGTGYNQFKRYEYYMQSRCGEDGTIMNPQMMTFKNYKEYLSQRSLNGAGDKTESINGDWTFFGAQNHSLGTSGYNGGIGRINIVAIDPNNSSVLYVGAPAGGLFKTTTGGSSWTPLTDGTAFWGVSGIVVDPFDSDEIYILTGDGDGGSSRSAGVWKTTNGGTTWAATGLTNDYTTSTTDGYKLMMDPSNHNTLYAVMTSGLWKTTDAGVTWTNMKTGSYRDMEFKPGTSSTIYLSSSNTIFKSTDSGATWSTINTIAGATRVALGVTAANSSYLYALAGPATSSGNFVGVFRSVDSGTTWTTRCTTPNILGYSSSGADDDSQTTYDLAIAVSPSNANVIHTGGVNVWTSTDGGTTMTIQSYWREDATGYEYTHADIHELVYLNGNLYCGSDGGVYKTTDGGTNWSDISSGLGITEWYRFGGSPLNTSLYIGGAQDNGSNKLEGTIPDLSMEHLYGADGMEAAIDPTDQNIMYCTSQNGGLRRSDDEGDNWTSIKPTNLGSGAWVTPFAINPNNPNELIAGYTEVGKHSTQGTPIANWVDLTSGAVGTGTCTHITYAPSNTNYIYVVKSSAVYRTTDGGTNWSNITAGLPGGTYSYIAVDPNDPNRAYVTRQSWTANSKIWRTTDGGSTWSNISGAALPNVPANCVVATSGSLNGLYLGTDAGVYYFNDGLGDWVDFSNGLPFCRVMEMEINPLANRLRACTYGRSVWETDLYSGSCTDDLILSGNLSGTQYIEANYTIESTNLILNGADITFSAGEYILLLGGFETQLGAEFLATMDGCSASKNDAEPVSGNFVENEEALQPTSGSMVSDIELLCYPNPFRNSTWISYKLPEASPVQIDLYDAQGKLVFGLAKESMAEAGIHSFRVEANELPAGHYFARMIAGEKTATTKLVVVK